MAKEFVKIKTIDDIKSTPKNVWCVVEVPNYCPSGYMIAKWDGKDWKDEFELMVTEYVISYKKIS